MSPPSLAFIATPDFTGDILEHILTHRLAHIKALWTAPSKPQGRGKKVMNSRLVRLSEQYGIPCYQPYTLSSKENIESLIKLNVDLSLVVAYGKILPQNFFTIPKWGTYNIHFSLLPKYRGASPIQSAILAGEKQTGITLQIINEKMDAGDVILQSSFDIRDLKAPLVFEKSTLVSLKIISEFLKNVPKNLEGRKPQSHHLATYCSKIEKDSGRLRINDTAENVVKKFLAFDPWPGIYFTFKGERFQILDLEKIKHLAHEEHSSKRTSKKYFGYVHTKGGNLFLTLKDGTLMIKCIKRQGRKALTARDFLNGCHLHFPFKID